MMKRRFSMKGGGRASTEPRANASMKLLADTPSAVRLQGDALGTARATGRITPLHGAHVSGAIQLLKSLVAGSCPSFGYLWRGTSSVSSKSMS